MADDRRIVRVNVEVIYDDGTFDELKGVLQDDDPDRTRIGGEFKALSTRTGASGPLLCVPR